MDVDIRGVIIMQGHLEEDALKRIFLVGFGNRHLNQGKPIVC
jgi:hypothetical protein